jgi:hypothetical protein
MKEEVIRYMLNLLAMYGHDKEQLIEQLEKDLIGGNPSPVVTLDRLRDNKSRVFPDIGEEVAQIIIDWDNDVPEILEKINLVK